jgi:hypothetical protein
LFSHTVCSHHAAQQRIKPTAPWVVLAEVIAFNRRGGSYLSLGGNKK